MNYLALVSLMGLGFAIAAGFLKGINVGIVCISIAYVIAVIFRIPPQNIIKGFSSSLFLTMLGVTYLFSVINANGTLTVLADKIVGRKGGRTYLLPLVLWLLGFFLSAMGPGAIPGLALMPMISIPMALQSGYNPIMLSVIAVCGTMAGRMSPITPEGVLVHELLSKQGLDHVQREIFWCMVLAGLINGIAAFVLYRGWRVVSPIRDKTREKSSLTKVQVLSLAALVVMAIGALGFRLQVGLLSFVLGSLLIFLGAANEKQVIAGIPWNVLLMCTGVGMLMEVLLQSGGVDLLVKGLSAMMSERTAAPILLLVGGVMSFFSSGMGVVFPTLLPTVSGIAQQVGGTTSAVELAAMVVIGGTVAGFTPISTTGALIMAGIGGNDEAKKTYPENKMFIALTGWALVMLLVPILCALVGVYRYIA